MANAVLEREIARIEAERTRDDERSVRDSVRKTEERAFNERIHGNYQRLLFGDKDVLSGKTVETEAPVSAPSKEAKPAAEFVPSAAERVAQYTPVPNAASAGRKVLFENVAFKNGELVDTTERKEETPVAVISAAPAAAPAIVPETDAEDSVPTRRTMDTLRRAEENRESAVKKESVSFALSSKMKLAIAAVALIIVLAIAIICVNTSVINSLNADITQLQATSQALASQAAEIEGNIAEVTAWENVMEFAKQLGMVIPD